MPKQKLYTNNKKIKLRIYNPSKNNEKPIIFLPGYNMKPADYKKFLKKLNKKVYAIDYLSSKPRVNSLEDYIGLVRDIVKKLNLKNYHLIGHSLGGGISFLVSDNFQDKIPPEKAVAINPLSEIDYSPKEFPRRFLKIAKHKFFRRLGLYIIFTIRYIFYYTSLRKLYRDIKGFKIPENVKTPFLILLAEKDEFFNEKQIPKKKFVKMKLIKTPGRHFNLVSFPEETGKKVSDFLN